MMVVLLCLFGLACLPVFSAHLLLDISVNLNELLLTRPLRHRRPVVEVVYRLLKLYFSLRLQK
jgi:hypothetical protein